MPLTTDEKLLGLSRETIEVFDKVNGGVHPGFRPAHAKGILLTGTFTPSREAASLTRAPHLHRNSTPVTVRFSDFAGIPAVADNDPGGPHPNAIEQFLGAHPAASTSVQIPKPIPTSFAKESFFAVSAFKFTNSDGTSRYGRYRVLPVAGNEYLDEAEAAARSPDFLFAEIKERVAKKA